MDCRTGGKKKVTQERINTMQININVIWGVTEKLNLERLFYQNYHLLYAIYHTKP